MSIWTYLGRSWSSHKKRVTMGNASHIVSAADLPTSVPELNGLSGLLRMNGAFSYYE